MVRNERNGFGCFEAIGVDLVKRERNDHAAVSLFRQGVTDDRW